MVGLVVVRERGRACSSRVAPRWLTTRGVVATSPAESGAGRSAGDPVSRVKFGHYLTHRSSQSSGLVRFRHGWTHRISQSSPARANIGPARDDAAHRLHGPKSGDACVAGASTRRRSAVRIVQHDRLLTHALRSRHLSTDRGRAPWRGDQLRLGVGSHHRSRSTADLALTRSTPPAG